MTKGEYKVAIIVALFMITGLFVGLNLNRMSCQEDEVLVFDNHSHSRCIHIDDLQKWMDEQND